MSWIGIPSVMVAIRRIPAAAASMIASDAKGGGTKIPLALAPVSLTASATVLKTGTSRCVVPPLPGLTPPTSRVPISFICSAWKDPSRPVMPCTITRVSPSRRIAIRRCPPPSSGQLDDLLGGLPAARARLDAVLLKNGPALLLVGPGEPHDQGQCHAEAVAGLDQAAGDLVAARDAAEDVDQDAADLRVHQDHRQRVLHHLGLGATADVAEVGRRAPRPLHQVEGAHAEAGAV